MATSMQPRFLNLKPSLYGFTLVRNAIKYDYPLYESLMSMQNLVDKIFIALGDCDEDDETLKLISTIPSNISIAIQNTIWDMSLKRGHVLSAETNKALSFLKATVGIGAGIGNLQSAWGLYLQADEVLHESENQQLLADLALAEEGGYDAISFRYLHFWQSHYAVAISKQWYPREVRAIKLDSSIASYGDAQGFSGATKIFYSDVTVYHYGHVRDPKKYFSKTTNFHALYSSGNALLKKIKKEERGIEHHSTLRFLGPHPKIMKERIERIEGLYKFQNKKDRMFYLSEKIADDTICERAEAKLICGVKKYFSTTSFIINPKWWERLLTWNFTPIKSKSKLASHWPAKYQMIFFLAARGIGFKQD